MQLTLAQQQKLKAAILADTTAAALWTKGDFVGLTGYVNTRTSTLAWRNAVAPAELLRVIDFDAYDTVPIDRMTTFRLMLDFGPIDATLTNIQNGIVAIFHGMGTQGGLLLNVCTEGATWGEVALATTPAGPPVRPIPPGMNAPTKVITRGVIGLFTVQDIAALQGV